MNQTAHHSNNALDLAGDALPVTLVADEQGAPVACTFWAPTPEELAAIAAGAPVVLGLRVPPGVEVRAMVTVEGEGWAQFGARPGPMQ